MPNPYYIKKNTGFLTVIDEKKTEAFIYQPTPEGVAVLCEHYTCKYRIDLKSIDLRGKIPSGDNAFHFFDYLKRHPMLLDIKEGCARGLVLGHGQFHAIPVLLCKRDQCLHMMVFDSSSGARVKGYFQIAELFPEIKFYLNAGTRQADEGSCMTDAICVLKEALQVLPHEMISLINSKLEKESRALQPNRFFNKPKPDNFYLFRMPERLLLTAQISKYIEDAQADLSILIRGGKPLKFYRDEFTIPVYIHRKDSVSPVNISGYLYLKAQEHKETLDEHWQREQLSQTLLGLLAYVFKPISPANAMEGFDLRPSR